MPSTVSVGWLDGAGELIATAPGVVASTVFEPSGDGVVNTAAIDAGVAGTGWVIESVGLYDQLGRLLITAALPAPLSPAAGDVLRFGVGALTFGVV